MGLQKLKRGRLLLCLFLLASCGDQDAVKPGPKTEVDPAAVALAGFALNAAVLSSYPFYRPGPLRPDVSVIDFRYTREFLDSVDLPVFRDCYKQSNSCFSPETTGYGYFYPAFWADGNSIDPCTLQVYVFPDSIQSLRPPILLMADSARVMDSIYFAYVTYLGRFASDVISTDSFQTTRFAYRLYSRRDPCDTIEGAIWERRPGACLIPNVLPDSGIFQKSWYYNPSRQSGISRLSVWARTEGTRLDSLARIYYYAADTIREEFYGNSLYRVSSNTATLVKGVLLSDTSFLDTLLPGNRIFNGFRHPGGRFTLGTVLNASGDTLFALSASPLEDTVNVEFSGRSAAFVRQGEGLALTDASGTRTAAATAAYGVLKLVFSSSDGLFSGEIYLNTLTGMGSGTLVNHQGGVTYSISVNVSGASAIEDIGL